MKTYKILSSYDDVLTFTVKELPQGVEYSLYHEREDEKILIYTATDTEDDFLFHGGLSNIMDYHDVDYLNLFLNMIKRIDERLFDSYIITEPIGQI